MAHAAAERIGGGTVTGAAPVLADGVQLLGEMSGSGYRTPPALVRRADGQTITLTPLLYLILKAIDGRSTTQSIADRLSDVLDRHVTSDDVEHLLEQKLRPLGLLAGTDGVQPATKKSHPLLALKLKVVVTNQAVTRRLTSPFAWLFAPVVALPLLGAFFFISWWLLIEKGLASAAHQALYEPGLILTVWAMIVASAAFHEFGHAAACRYGGATPGAMGAGLYLVWPAFYTDVTDSYQLGRGGRLRVDLGGLYFNALFAVGTWAVWWLVRWDALLLVVVAQHLQMVRQLAPFIRADGYHIIADLIGVPDLFAHIKPTLKSVLPRRWRGSERPALKRWARAVVVLWVALVVPVLIGVLAVGALLLPRIAATAWDSMRLQWQAATTHWADGDIAGSAVRGVSVLLVALPVAGLVYLLVRILRRSAASAWKATDGAPRRRAGVLVLGAALAGVLAWLWWPADQYRPIDADDEGSLDQLVRMEDRRIFLPLLEPRAAAPRAAFVADQATMPVRRTVELDVRRTTGAPVLIGLTDDAGTFELAGVRTATARPQTGAAAPTSRGVWPFPFPMPDPTAPGDNRAMAVNTTDGTAVTDLAVSWALVTATTIEQRNDAWALASCQDCLTRAVALQILLLVGSPEIVQPINAAIAANYECTRCTTEAIAVQLVVSLTGMPSEDAQARIDEAARRVELLEADLATLSGDQIYFLLQATQAEIMEILKNDGQIPSGTTLDAVTATSQPGDTAATAPPEPSETGPVETPTSPTGSEAEPSASDTTSDPTTGTPAPAPEPTPAATAEPTVEPSPEPTTSEPAPTEPSSDPATGAETSSSTPSPSPDPVAP